MAAHNELGKWGEDQAADYLQRKGYTIIERDWKSGKRDLDIVAIDEDKNIVVFVEVKTRRNRLFGEPEESVDYHKIRFDIISIVGTVGTDPDIQHIQDVTLL